MNIFGFIMIIMITVNSPQMCAMSALQKKQDEIAKKQLEKAQEAALKKSAPESAEAKKIIKQLGVRHLIILFDPKKDEQDECFPKAEESTAATKTATITALLHLLDWELGGPEKPIAPILISRYTWDFVLDIRKSTCRSRISEPWLKNINKLEHAKVYTLKDDPSVMLFIPRNANNESYWQKINNYSVYPQKDNKLSDGELLLGIKVKSENLIEIEDPFILPQSTNREPTSDDLKKYLQQILVTYKDTPEGHLNDWDIYLIGHGLSGSNAQIAGMKPTTFGEFLDFLNLRIHTRSLYYETCHSGGNLLEPYQYMQGQEGKKEIRKKEFNFIIISATRFDLPSEVIKPIPTNYFEELDKYFINKNQETLLKAIRLIASPTLLARGLAKAPAILFPHTEWFKLGLMNNSAFIINDSLIMRTINQGQKEIIIPLNTGVIIIESQYIPIPIVIQSNIFPLIMPVDIKKNYLFKEIRATQATLAPTPQASSPTFISMLEELNQKAPKIPSIFYIEHFVIKAGNKKAADSNNNPIELSWPSEAIDLTNVICLISSKVLFVIYQNSVWRLNANIKVEDQRWGPVSTTIMKIHDDIIDEIRNESKLPESMKSENPKPMFEISPSTGPKPTIKSNAPQEPKSSEQGK